MNELIPTQIPPSHPSYLYALLGLNKYAVDEEIKQAYREAAQKHHPDRGGDPEVFKTIQQAYAILSDPKKRIDYDATGVYEGNDAAKVETARNIVTARIRNIIQDQDIDLMYIDIVSTIKEGLRTDIYHCKKGIKISKKSIKRLKKGRKRARTGLIRYVFDENIKTIKEAIQQMHDDSELLSLALKIAGPCGYEFDEKPAPVIPRGYVTLGEASRGFVWPGNEA